VGHGDGRGLVRSGCKDDRGTQRAGQGDDSRPRRRHARVNPAAARARAGSWQRRARVRLAAGAAREGAEAPLRP
jgi:hypothetical protein